MTPAGAPLPRIGTASAHLAGHYRIASLMPTAVSSAPPKISVRDHRKTLPYIILGKTAPSWGQGSPASCRARYHGVYYRFPNDSSSQTRNGELPMKAGRQLPFRMGELLLQFSVLRYKVDECSREERTGRDSGRKSK
jgi:hypothetical protein